jgi:hypothetical protein
MTSYTKGPWQSVKVQGAFAIVAPGNNTIAHVRDVYSDEHRTAPHDADLFALAPELVDALRALLTNHTLPEDWRHVPIATVTAHGRARALLARIDGEKVS